MKTDELTPADSGWADALAADCTADLGPDLTRSGAIESHITEALELRTQAVSELLTGSFDQKVFSRAAAEYARRHPYELGVYQIADTNRQLLGRVLGKAIASGQTYAAVREDVAEYFTDLQEWETYRIAASEIGNASRYGNILATKATCEEYDIEVARAFLIPAADACASICLPLAAETEARIFTLEEAHARSGGLHPHCRCDWGYEFAEEVLRVFVRLLRRWSR